MTEADITMALEKRYCLPEWAFLAQVTDRTGGARRYADGLAMNLYPSRGLEIIGFEIKISRSDLKRELANPEKAEDIARYCNTWCIVVPEGLLRDSDEIPIGWGVLTVSDQDNNVKMTKRALFKNAEPVTKEFVASILRRAAEREKCTFEGYVERHVNERVELRLNLVKNQKTFEHDRLIKRCEDLQTRINDFEEASGMKLSGYNSPQSFGKAAALLVKHNVTGTFGLLETLRRDMKKIDEVLQVLGQFIGDEHDPEK